MLTIVFKNHFSTKIVLLLILGFSLSGCGLPIIVSGTELMTIGTGDRGGSLAIFYSLTIYAIWLGVFISIPLNIKRTFTVPQRYKKYKLFWWIISLVHMISWLLLLHYRLQDIAFYWGFMIPLFVIILLPTLLPAAYQYRKKSKQQGAE